MEIILSLTSESYDISESLVRNSINRSRDLRKLYEAIKYRNTVLKKMLSLNNIMLKLLDDNIDDITKKNV